MLDRIVEVFCEVDDFCQAFVPQWEASLLGTGGPAPRGPQPGLSPSEIITLLLVPQFRFQASQELLSRLCRAAVARLLSRHAVLRALRRPAEKCLRAAGVLPRSATWGPGPGSTTSIPPPCCDNHRINRHKVFAGLAQRGKTSMGWFFGFKLHLVFNTDNEIVALKLTPGNVHDTTPVPALTRELTGKLFGDKGYIGQKLAEDLLRRGLTLFTRVRRNMKSLPLSLQDKACSMPGTWPRPSSATSRSSRPSICPSIDPQSTPSFTSSRPSPPTRSTRSSPSSIFSPAIISKPQPEKPLIRVNVTMPS